MKAIWQPFQSCPGFHRRMTSLCPLTVLSCTISSSAVPNGSLPTMQMVKGSLKALMINEVDRSGGYTDRESRRKVNREPTNKENQKDPKAINP